MVATANIASTAIGAKKSSSLMKRHGRVSVKWQESFEKTQQDIYADKIFELIEVLAMLIRQSLPSLSTLVDSCSAMNRQASLQANLYHSKKETVLATVACFSRDELTDNQ